MSDDLQALAAWIADHTRRTVDYLRLYGPWLLRDALRAGLVLILATVSGWYLTRWALYNGWPVGIAWTLFVALDMAGLLSIVVLSHPRDAHARRSALHLAIGAAGLSVLGNSAMHAADHGWLPRDPQTALICAVVTGAVYPLMLVWAAHVATGMAVRPGRRNVSPARSEVTDRKRATAGRARPAAALAAPAPPALAPPGAEVAGAVSSVDREYDRDSLVAWALTNAQPNGQPAGWKRIRSAHDGLSEHHAKAAWRLARAGTADADTEQAGLMHVGLHVVGGNQ